MSAFGDKAFRKVIKVKQSPKSGALTQQGWERHQTALCLHMGTEGRPCEDTVKKVAVYKSRRDQP